MCDFAAADGPLDAACGLVQVLIKRVDVHIVIA
jgi:hypothetical protein